MTEPDLPRYRDLPRTAEGVGTAWGLFGPDDSLGLMNLLTPAKAAEAVRLARTGRVFPLDLPLGFMTPPPFGRGTVRHTTKGSGWTLDSGPSRGLDDKLDDYFPQSGSQWDSLGHAGYDVDRFWNGRSTDEVRAGANTIDHVAARGIVTRGVLLDVAEVVAERGGPGERVEVTVEDLETARRRAGVEIGAGDILLLHTGFVDWYAQQPSEVRERLADRTRVTAAGLGHGPEMAEYLWDLHVVAVAGDTLGGEAFPNTELTGTPFDFMHRVLLGGLGMMLGELWDTGPLARDCRRDGVHEFLLMSAPLRIPQGIGSPANALAVK